MTTVRDLATPIGPGHGWFNATKAEVCASVAFLPPVAGAHLHFAALQRLCSHRGWPLRHPDLPARNRWQARQTRLKTHNAARVAPTSAPRL
jgi:hypothetical protein